MTSFEIEELAFDRPSIAGMPGLDPRLENWPVVYLLDDARRIYVGESIGAATRMRQHIDSQAKQGLRGIRVILDDTFNKSVCLDLESHLIRWFAGDGRFAVMNRNDGIIDSDYYRRSDYREVFRDVFEELHQAGMFTRSIPHIENSDLFKLSPFKSLNRDQAVAVDAVMEGLAADLEAGLPSMSVIQGDPGTGKTIVGIYIMKLLRDIADARDVEDAQPDSIFADLFLEENRQLFEGLRVGLVVPQQSLRESIRRVFKRTPSLHAAEVVTPFQVGKDPEPYDILVVDEAHRLTQLAAQAMGTLTSDFREINSRLFGGDESKTQLDWLQIRSKHVIALLDSEQSVRPTDISPGVFTRLVDTSRRDGRLFPLHSQMRVAGGNDYISFVRALLSDEPPQTRPDFGEYELKLFDDFGEMVDSILARDAEFGLSRLVAGYAWPWRSKKDRSLPDIEIDGIGLPWNRNPTDWINSPTSLHEVGSIHTVQGYDLNYAGVIIGGDLTVDPTTGELCVDRDSYFDTKGKANNVMRGQVTTNEDLLRYVQNIYRVLMTRGIKGTYVYICDGALKQKLRSSLESSC
ncbi:DNA/RNA helicase domain-containing protein [Brachybacterium sp. NPDC056505]|uniref:DNA/RNA helicase domain-containing protein n=1 Tax=Brachybacterium sp. NPDC056505 TaxID=3345843 RepID=UPI0036733CC4